MFLLFTKGVKVIPADLPGMLNAGCVNQFNGNRGAIPALRVVNTFQLKPYLDLHILGYFIKYFEYRTNGIALRNTFCQGNRFACVRLDIYGGARLRSAVPRGHCSVFRAFDFKPFKNTARRGDRSEFNGA